MSLEAKAAILSVGTELTSGELVNSNAAWLSEKLEDLGLEVMAHLTVPDEGNAILEGLEYLENRCSFLFVTGGLGPTKDDFTRDWIARWANLELKLDNECLKRLEAKFQALGRPFHEFQKQQCYFPAGAKVHSNDAGTADGFSLQKQAVKVWVLPGPPREIEHLWENSVGEDVGGKIVRRKELQLRSWLCFGEGESAIANLVEGAMEKLPFQTGYRAHSPYVEVKIWGKPEDFKKHEELRLLDEVLAPYLISRTKETLSQQMLSALPSDLSVHIWDGVSGGWFLKNLETKEISSSQRQLEITTVFDRKMLDEIKKLPAKTDLQLCVFPESRDGRFVAAIKFQGKWRTESYDYPSNRIKKHQSVWAMERACLIWKNWLLTPPV